MYLPISLHNQTLKLKYLLFLERLSEVAPQGLHCSRSHHQTSSRRGRSWTEERRSSACPFAWKRSQTHWCIWSGPAESETRFNSRHINVKDVIPLKCFPWSTRQMNWGKILNLDKTFNSLLLLDESVSKPRGVNHCEAASLPSVTQPVPGVSICNCICITCT